VCEDRLAGVDRRFAHPARGFEPHSRYQEGAVTTGYAASRVALSGRIGWSTADARPNVLVVRHPERPKPNQQNPLHRHRPRSRAIHSGAVLHTFVMKIDEHLNIVADIAERLDNPEGSFVYVARYDAQGRRFQDAMRLDMADRGYHVPQHLRS